MKKIGSSKLFVVRNPVALMILFLARSTSGFQLTQGVARSRFSHHTFQYLFYVAAKKNSIDDNEIPHEYEVFADRQRRNVWKKAFVKFASLSIGVTTLAAISLPALASSRSRTDGYVIQKTEAEWKEILSPMAFFVLRKGGTEQPGYSILETEKREGKFHCAACDTQLFSSKDKFNSRTGWPSFARALETVQVDDVNAVTANLAGAELRCSSCGGHLGDVFNDGFLFRGTEAAISGKRYCIDGAALVFYSNESGADPVRGDLPSKTQESTLPSFLAPPKINARENRNS